MERGYNGKMIRKQILRAREHSRKDLLESEKTEKKKTSSPLPHGFMEDTVRHNIAQMTSASKAYIPCLLAIIIKWCHMIR